MNIESPIAMVPTAEKPTKVESKSLTVGMRREGQFCNVDATCAKVLRRILRTREWQCQQRPDGPLEMSRHGEFRLESGFWFNIPVLKFLSGLWPVVLTGLQQAGIDVKLEGGFQLASLQLPAPRKTLPDVAALEHIARHDRGLIRYDAQCVNPVYLVAQIARAWPELNIAVITPRRHDAVDIAVQLRQRGIDAFGYTGQNHPWVEARVAVCTLSGLAFTPLEPEKRDIVIVLDAALAISEHPRWCLGFTQRARMYGFLSLDRPLSPYDEDLIRCMFGFDEMIVPQHGYRMRPIEVGWAQCKSPWPRRMMMREAESDFLLKRYGIWNNDWRNRLIARLARAFVADDQEILTRSLLRWPARKRTGPPANVFIIVETIEHALKLLPKLPGWSILAGGLADLTGLSDAQRDAIRNPRSAIDPLISVGIITHGGMRRQEMPWARADVIIRADGGTDLLGLPAAALVAPASSARPLTLIDFDDTHHPELERRATKRWKAYDKIGWFHPDMDATGFRIAEFLRKRTGKRRKRGGA